MRFYLFLSHYCNYYYYCHYFTIRIISYIFVPHDLGSKQCIFSGFRVPPAKLVDSVELHAFELFFFICFECIVYSVFYTKIKNTQRMIALLMTLLTDSLFADALWLYDVHVYIYVYNKMSIVHPHVMMKIMMMMTIIIIM